MPDSARNALDYVEYLLRDGFTGTLIMECSQGGVAEVKESKITRAKDLVGQEDCARSQLT